QVLRLRVGLVTGCVQRVFFGEVNAATARVLAAEGCEVVVPAQGCCGALELHAGREDAALARARRVIAAFDRAGVDRVLTIDLHAEQIQAFFDIPVDHLYATPVLVEYHRQFADNLVVVAPDTGRANRARGFAQRLGKDTPIAIIDKRRTAPNQVEALRVVGEVEGLDALIFDDMVDTGGTLIRAAEALVKAGARNVRATATHGIFSGDAVHHLVQSPITEIIITDTILQPPAKSHPKIKVLTISALLAEAIFRIHREESVSSLFID
ncbi:MAG: ribose-phosphate diphosphokinase, partial [candidate division WOR-3 bacterium]